MVGLVCLDIVLIARMKAVQCGTQLFKYCLKWLTTQNYGFLFAIYLLVIDFAQLNFYID